MAGSKEVRSQGLEWYRNFNKLTLTGAIIIALLVPALRIPAIAVAAVDVVQIVAIDKINNKKSGGIIFNRASK